MKPLNKIMLWKRNGSRAAALKTQMDNAVARLAVSVKSIINDPSANKNEMLAKTFGQFLDHCNKLTKRKTSLEDIAKLHAVFDARHKNLDVSISEAGPDEGMPNERDEDDEDNDENGAHHAGDAGENGSGSVDQLERAERAMKEKNMQTRKQEMRKLAGLSPLEFCKKISADGDSYDLDEAQVHSVVQCVAKNYARSGESEGAAFLRLLSGTDEISKACNTALTVAKHAGWAGRAVAMSKAAGMPGRATLEPSTTRGWDGQAVDDPRAAVDAMRSLIDAQRSAHKPLSESGDWRDVAVSPKESATEKLNTLRDELARKTGLSPDLAYAQVYASHPDLAMQERLESRARLTASSW
jgi:hypothetical protein